jgi:hypothetical protein
MNEKQAVNHKQPFSQKTIFELRAQTISLENDI